MIKKGILLLMAVPLLTGMVSCGQTVSGSSDKNNATDVKEVRNDGNKTVMLTKAEFLSKVMNYEENPQEWKYLGEKPCLIDFYADWCGPCVAMEKKVFSVPEVVELGKYFVTLRIDLTKKHPNQAELLKHYKIRGVPTIIFVNRDGIEETDLRIESYVKRNDVLKRMKMLIEKP